MHKSYKTELHPNNKQITLLKKHCDASRFAFNWGLEQRKTLWESEQKSTNAIALHKKLNELKKTDFGFLYETSKCAPQEALRDLDKAFKNFFAKRSGFPKFKSRKNDRQSFRLTGAILVDEKEIKLPRIGWIRLKEDNYIPGDKHILSATVSCHADRWFVSLNVKEDDSDQQELSDKVLGIDVGIKTLATCSDGRTFDNPKTLYKKEKKLKRAQRALSRKKRGSNNRLKAKNKLAKIHYKVSNIRKDVLHKITTAVARTKPRAVVMENLKIQNMTKNRHLSKSILDCAWAELRRQLDYKLEWIGSELILADTFYPSSKMCRKCFAIKKDLTLSDRIYLCDECFHEEDRDLHASINLENYPKLLKLFQDLGCKSWNDFKNTVSSTEFEACGEERFMPVAFSDCAGALL